MAATAIVREVPAGQPGGTRLVGTGPFVLASLEPARVVVERNATYWRSGLPRVDAIEFRPSLSPSAIARQFRERGD